MELLPMEGNPVSESLETKLIRINKRCLLQQQYKKVSKEVEVLHSLLDKENDTTTMNKYKKGIIDRKDTLVQLEGKLEGLNSNEEGN